MLDIHITTTDFKNQEEVIEAKEWGFLNSGFIRIAKSDDNLLYIPTSIITRILVTPSPVTQE